MVGGIGGTVRVSLGCSSSGSSKVLGGLIDAAAGGRRACYRTEDELKILVTGATGYVGGRLVPLLLERGHEVRTTTSDPDREQPGGGTG